MLWEVVVAGILGEYLVTLGYVVRIKYWGFRVLSCEGSEWPFVDFVFDDIIRDTYWRLLPRPYDWLMVWDEEHRADGADFAVMDPCLPDAVERMEVLVRGILGEPVVMRWGLGDGPKTR